MKILEEEKSHIENIVSSKMEDIESIHKLKLKRMQNVNTENTSLKEEIKSLEKNIKELED